VSKFNKIGSRINKTGNTINIAGGSSYERPFKDEIATIVLNSMLSGKDSYYESEFNKINRIEEIINSVNDIETIEYIAKAAIYSRTVGNMRSLPVLLTVLLAEKIKDNELIRKLVRTMVQRPDEMTEIVSLWDSRNHNKINGKSKNVPSSIRRGLKDILESDKFNAFGYKRYFGTGKVKISDIVNIAHPKPKNDEMSKMFKQILEKNLPNIETLETLRPNGMDSKSAIMKLLNDKKLGYMAAIKNIKNFVEANPTDEEFDTFFSYIENEKAIINSKVFPFRYWDAWKMTSTSNINVFRLKRIKKALDKVFKIASKNFELIAENERVAIILDESGSMHGNNFDNACVLSGMVASKIPNENFVVYSFDSNCRERQFNSNEVFDSIERILSAGAMGGATYFSKPMEKLLASKTIVDKIFIFTDMQMYSNYVQYDFVEYIKRYQKINPNVKLIFWNLQSYAGGTPISLHNDFITEISGFSSNMVEKLPFILKNKNFIVEEIENIILQ
jgi:hypothetical protein